QCPDEADPGPEVDRVLGHTRYLAPVGDSTIFPSDRGTKIKEIADGTSKTIMIVEAEPDRAVIWTKPDDLEVDLENPKRGLTDGARPFNAARADGSVQTISGDIDSQTLRALFTRD